MPTITLKQCSHECSIHDTQQNQGKETPSNQTSLIKLAKLPVPLDILPVFDKWTSLYWQSVLDVCARPC